ncbi:hypothetical protein RND71_035354 [Anisodus tanguticus]|uniref:Uncharacterized protein n=1 Tax=Anisodus tanguticus TaxID=243964 RepID=A0AAE1R4Z7_9SOLA|nr:hypothetical protein RND71_035354 [Anisodus tanguticus]
MVAFIKVLAFIFYPAFMAQGCRESFKCNPDIVISQIKLEETFKVQLWNASIANTCESVISNVKLSIPNFDSVTKVVTVILSKSHDDIYDVDQSRSIDPHTDVYFT